MIYEGPPPAHNQVPGYPEGLPQPGLFNLAEVSDERAVRLGLSVYHEILRPDIGPDAQREAGMLFQRFSADMAHLAVVDPARGRPLLMRLAQSDNAEERWLAIEAAVPLCVQDYEFAGEMFLAAQDKVRATTMDYEEVVGALSSMQDFLPLELAEDITERTNQRWPEVG